MEWLEPCGGHLQPLFHSECDEEDGTPCFGTAFGKSCSSDHSFDASCEGALQHDDKPDRRLGGSLLTNLRADHYV